MHSIIILTTKNNFLTDSGSEGILLILMKKLRVEKGVICDNLAVK